MSVVAWVAAPPAALEAAPTGFSVAIVAHTVFGPGPSEFESNIPGCATGTVADGGAVRLTPWGGTYVGLKHFTCDGGDSGFDIRLKARFSGGGSSGTWTLADAWGDYTGVKGSGSLVGIPTTQTSIDDIYTGVVR